MLQSFAGKHALLVFTAMLSLVVFAQSEPKPLESDWMQLVRGHRDKSTGVEMRDVTVNETEGTRTIMLSIPKSSMHNPNEIEEVIVIGRRPEKPEPLDISYEWVDDYDNDNYGLIIRLGKDSNWPIRLYIDSAPGYINN